MRSFERRETDMAYYVVCPDCGCNLDPGEKCDCGIKESEKRELMERMFRASPVTGQYEFQFNEKTGKRASGSVV